MEFATALAIADEALSAHLGRHLSDVETAILAGAWEGQTYEQIADQAGYSASYLTRTVGPQLWKNLSEALGEPVSKTNFRGALMRRQEEHGEKVEQPKKAAGEPPEPVAGDHNVGWQPQERTVAPYAPVLTPDNPPPVLPLQVDWGEILDVSQFSGRAAELEQLQRWLLQDRCRLVAILGLGGVGKSSLAAKLMHDLAEETAFPAYSYIIWRSLRNAPPLETLLSELILFLSDQTDTRTDMRRLLHWLRTHRCLVVLDNLETLMEAGDRAGQYRDDCGDYGELLRTLGESTHQSCVILTSREKPAELAAMEGLELAVRSLQLTGAEDVGLAILAAKGLVGSAQERAALCDRYSSNPLALKIVASTIQDLFAGAIAPFVEQDTFLFNGIRRLLDQQCDRLSDLERSILYWLAINREWTAIAELQRDLLPSVPQPRLLEALELLRWRSLIETQAGRYTLQPVVMEYVTDQLTGLLAAELVTGNLLYFDRHAVLKTTLKDYLCASQKRLILQPIVDHLNRAFPTTAEVTVRLKEIFAILRRSPAEFVGYGGGNLINLWAFLQMDLTGFDLSHMTIRQADLRHLTLHHVNAAHTTFVDAAFLQTFGIVCDVAFSPDGTLLATASSNGDIRLWQTTTGELVASFVGHTSWIWSISFSPDGQFLASSGVDRIVNLWDVRQQQLARTLTDFDHWIWSVSFSPDGTILATSDHQATIKLWEVASGRCLLVLPGHQAAVRAVCWQSSGWLFASASDDTTIKLWNLQSDQCIRTITDETQWIDTVSFSPDGHLLASSHDHCKIKLWDVATGELLTTLENPPNTTGCLAWSPDGTFLISGGHDNNIKLWDATVALQTSSHQPPLVKVLRGHNSWVRAARFSPDGSLIASGSYDHTAKLWDVQTGQVLRTFYGYINRTRSAVFSPDGQHLVHGCADCTAKLWEVETGTLVRVFSGHQNWVWATGLTSDARYLVTGGLDMAVKLWDVASGQLLQTLKGHKSWVWTLDIHPDDRLLATGSPDGVVKLWNLETGEQMRSLEDHADWVWAVRFSPSGRYLASGGQDGTVRVWDGASGSPIACLEGHTAAVESIAWHPDETALVSGSTDGTIRLWQMPAGECLASLQAHRHWVREVAYSPNGDQFVSCSFYDGLIKLWDATTLECLKTLQSQAASIMSVAFNPQGDRLASCASDVVELWDLKTATRLRVLRSNRPYEGMKITGVRGLTEAQKTALEALGATG